MAAFPQATLNYDVFIEIPKIFTSPGELWLSKKLFMA